MLVLEFNKFEVHMYSHHAPPHFHLRFIEADDLVLSLPNLKILAGDKKELQEYMKELLIDNIDFLCTKWDELNLG